MARLSRNRGNLVKDLISARGHASYVMFTVHRLSGVCLALFLPVHLYVISLLLDNPQSFDSFLDWTSAPLAKLSEAVLITLAGAHLAGGIRILLIEWFAVPYSQSKLIAAVAVFAVVIGLVFFSAVSL